MTFLVFMCRALQLAYVVKPQGASVAALTVLRRPFVMPESVRAGNVASQPPYLLTILPSVEPANEDGEAGRLVLDSKQIRAIAQAHGPHLAP